MKRFILRYYVTIVQEGVDKGDAVNRARLKFDDLEGGAVQYLDGNEVVVVADVEPGAAR